MSSLSSRPENDETTHLLNPDINASNDETDRNVQETETPLIGSNQNSTCFKWSMLIITLWLVVTIIGSCVGFYIYYEVAPKEIQRRISSSSEPVITDAAVLTLTDDGLKA